MQVHQLNEDWQALFVCFSPSGNRYYSGRRDKIFQAIKRFIEEDIGLHDLECLGLEERHTNALDKIGIQFLHQLIPCSIERLREIKYFGKKAIRQVQKSIYLLPELDRKRQEFILKLMPKIGDLSMIRKYGLAAVKDK